MKIIHRNEIGSKISTLIAESKEKFFAITPYVDVSKWSKIIINISNAINRGVVVKFFYRQISETDFAVLASLGAQLYHIENLHAKLYMNDSSVIVTSMNLYEYSDLNSLEIGLLYEKSEDYEELFKYFQKNILACIKEKVELVPEVNTNPLQAIYNSITGRFNDCQCVLTSKYIFSKHLLATFHVMISLTEITLKLPMKNVDADKIHSVQTTFDNADLPFKVIRQPLRENYPYTVWDISIVNYATDQVEKIISKLQGLCA